MNINTRDMPFINFNGQDMPFVNFNGVTVYEAWKNLIASGVPPLTLDKCKGVDLLDYKLYGNSRQGTLLPIEYQQLDYIEATGTQYFEIDYIATNNTNSKGVFQITDTGDGRMLFGSRVASGTRAYSLNWGGGQPYKYYNTFGSAVVTTKEIDKEKHSFEKKGLDLYIDDELIHSHAEVSNFTTPHKMVVFACNTYGTIGLFAPAKLYSLQFYDNDTLMVDLIPCYRKEDGIAGMYDLVNNVFYTNQGEGEFVKGEGLARPNAPIEIESVGDKTKNLFDISQTTKFFSYNNASVSSSYANVKDGVITSNRGMYGNAIFCDTNIKIFKKGTYTFICDVMLENDDETVVKRGYVGYYAGGKTVNKGFLLNENNTWQTIINTFTFDEDTLIDGLQFQAMGGATNYTTINMKFKNIQILEGSFSSINIDYEPYGYRIPVKVSGKNLVKNVKKTQTISGITFTINNDKSITINGTNTSGSNIIFPITSNESYVTFDIPLSENTTYTLSGGTQLPTGVVVQSHGRVNGSYQYKTYGKTPITFTTVESSNWSCYIRIDAGIVVDNVTMYPQIEEGTIATKYEPYVEPITTNIYLKEPLRKGGAYADYKDFKNQKVIRKMGNYIFDGTEEWVKHTVTKDGYGVFRIDDVLDILLKIPTSTTFMTHFGLTDIDSTANFTLGLYRPARNSGGISSSRIYISAEQTTVEEFKEWLANNKPSIVYPLATPIEEAIELPNIPTIKGTAILSVDTTIQPSNMEVIYKGKN